MSVLAANENLQAGRWDHDIREQAAQHTLAANALVGCAAATFSIRHACCSAS
jgi:hypothetical protein